MPRFYIMISLAFILLATACTKHDARTETVLYGTWVNSQTPKDTLRFMNKAGKNILRFSPSFNTTLPADTAIEYSYQNGKLSVALYGPNQPMKEIDSFTWQQQNKTFDILGFQLYLMMSSSATHFTYTKID